MVSHKSWCFIVRDGEQLGYSSAARGTKKCLGCLAEVGTGQYLVHMLWIPTVTRCGVHQNFSLVKTVKYCGGGRGGGVPACVMWKQSSS